MEVHHFDSIAPVVVNNTVDYEEVEVAVAEVDDHNSMVDKNVEVDVEIEEEVVHLDDENLEDVNLDVNVERVDDLHMDTADVDYQSDETDADAVAADRVVEEDVNNTAADLPDCNTDLVVVDNAHYY